MFYRRIRRLRRAAALFALLAAPAAASLWAASAPAETNDTDGRLTELERIAERIYEAAKSGDAEYCRELLEEYTAQMVKIAYDGMTGAEGLNALTQTLVQAKETFNKVRFSRQEGMTAAVKLRLATDALSPRSEPMWLEYRKVLKRDADELKEAASARDPEAARKALAALRGHYGIIRPSALIDREPAAVAKADSLLAFLGKEVGLSSPNFERIGQGASHLDEVLDGLFGAGDAETGGPVWSRRQPAAWTGVMAAVIVTVLAYAGWRIYAAEKRLSLRRPRD